MPRFSTAAFGKAIDLFRDYVDRQHDRSLIKLVKAAAIGLGETALATMVIWLIFWVGGWI